jgi:hypothetical protein
MPPPFRPVDPSYRVIVLAAALLLPACGGDGPSARDLRETLASQLPAYLEAASLDLDARQNTGSESEPGWSSSFRADLKLKEDTYEEVEREGDVLFVKRVAASGDERSVSGKALAALAGSSWRSSLTLDDDPTGSLGKPLGDFDAPRVIVVGSKEHAAYVEEKRAAVLSAGTFEGSATAVGAEFPVVVRFTAYDPRTRVVTGRVEWPSLGGATKHFHGQITGKSLWVRENGWVDHGDGSALYPLEYRLELDTALEVLTGSWQGGGFNGRVRLERS